MSPMTQTIAETPSALMERFLNAPVASFRPKKISRNSKREAAVRLCAGGPELPVALLTQQEQGNVIFFCGAGLSCNEGLPTFGQLADLIYEKLGTDTEDAPAEQSAMDSGEYDLALHLLEMRYPGGRRSMLRALESIILKGHKEPRGLAGHRAVLALSRRLDGTVRLVTTNYDRLFHEAGRLEHIAFADICGTKLAEGFSPKQSGIAFLHGLLPRKESAVDRSEDFVLTSGDFGRAYLYRSHGGDSDAPAARFVSRLFSEFPVCFIGYSAQDQMVAYILRTISAERARGQKMPAIWAFDGYSEGDLEERQRREREWEQKGVSPILYPVREKPTIDGRGTVRSHAALYETLETWAAMYRNGSAGKADLLGGALKAEAAGCGKDYVAELVLWLLSERSEEVARGFAGNHPDEKWLTRLTADGCRILDGLFTAAAGEAVDETLSGFSSTMTLWLSDYINREWLFRWMWELSQKGRILKTEARRILGDAVEKWEMDRKPDSAIPGGGDEGSRKQKAIRFWRVFLSQSPVRYPSYVWLKWFDSYNREGATDELLGQLRDYLRPVASFCFDRTDVRVRSIISGEWQFEVEVVPSAELERDWLLDHRNDFSCCTEELLKIAQESLLAALKLSKKLGRADERRDESTRLVPSISRSSQSRETASSFVLLELLGTLWQLIAGSNSQIARQCAICWWTMPFPAFKRLALFAAADARCLIPAEIWGRWLLSDNGYWLWASSTLREVCRLFAQRGRDLYGLPVQEQIETALVAGPSRETLCRLGINPGSGAYQDGLNGKRRVRLEKLNASELQLGDIAHRTLEVLRRSLPEEDAGWPIPEEANEFALYVGEFEKVSSHEEIPAERDALRNWMLGHGRNFGEVAQDDWKAFCREHEGLVVDLLLSLAAEDKWPTLVWSRTLYALQDESGQSKELLTGLMPLLERIPQERGILYALAEWVRGQVERSAKWPAADIVKLSKAIMVQCGAFDRDEGDNLEYAVAHVCYALMKLAEIEQRRNQNQTIPELKGMEEIWGVVLKGEQDFFDMGMRELGANTWFLMALDMNWCRRTIEPLLDWRASKLAPRVWGALLGAEQIDLRLVSWMIPHLPEVADHMEEIGEQTCVMLAQRMTSWWFAGVCGLSQRDLRRIFHRLPECALMGAADQIRSCLKAPRGGDPTEAWYTWGKPFWLAVWPKRADRLSGPVSRNLALVAIAADNAFPDAVDLLQDFLVPQGKPGDVMGVLKKSGLCANCSARSF